jgi:hypothetical protein
MAARKLAKFALLSRYLQRPVTKELRQTNAAAANDLTVNDGYTEAQTFLTRSVAAVGASHFDFDFSSVSDGLRKVLA